MATPQDLMALGEPVGLAQQLGFGQDEAKTALGTNQGTAFALVNPITQFTTVGSGTGCVLPATTTAGQPVAQRFWYVKNDGSNALIVYASGSDTISGVAGATGVSVAASTGSLFCMLNAGGGWIQLLVS